MPIELWTAPAGAGKTEFVIERARDAARDLQAIPCVCLPSGVQVRAFRRRLAQKGGGLGIHVMTFHALFTRCLEAAHVTYELLPDPMRHRLLRSVVDDLPLSYYAPLRTRPGFVRHLAALIAELKQEQVTPDAFLKSVGDLAPGGPRLRELALLYQTYQQRLHRQHWADYEELGWLAIEALERHPDLSPGFSLLFIDGFDSFTTVQLRAIQLLSSRAERLIVTLTDAAEGAKRHRAHGRFLRTAQQLRDVTGAAPRPLSVSDQTRNPTLRHIEAGLFQLHASTLKAFQGIDLLEAPSRASEVRAALRWIVERNVYDGIPLGELAILARSIEPYRPFIIESAQEFDIPIWVATGLPLGSNPVIAALLDLLEMMNPSRVPSSDGDSRMPRRLVIEAWHSPYFNWFDAFPSDDACETIGILPEDARDLAAAARQGQVIAGWQQWEEALMRLSACNAEDEQGYKEYIRAGAPIGARAEEILGMLTHFKDRLTPPLLGRYIDYVKWLEALIGDDPDSTQHARNYLPEPISLRVIERIREAEESIQKRDMAAVHALKDVLRSLVWAEELLGASESISFDRFLGELRGAVEATSYSIPYSGDRPAVLVSDVLGARGLSFRALALLGMSEGEFPQVGREDPFLRESDRRALREKGLSIQSSLQSDESEYFYEAVTHARERLYLLRPRLADDGAPWQPSPFWDDLRRLLNATPQQITTAYVPPPSLAASWSELLEGLASCGGPGLESPLPERWSEQWEAIQAGAEVLRARQQEETASPYEGDLTALGLDLSKRYGAQHVWSASRLERYRLCPFSFFTSFILRLQPRVEPEEGLDMAQLGTIYHRILEELYVSVTDTTDLDELLAALPSVASRVLDEAPDSEGFRVTAWWEHVRVEIEDDIRRSVEAMSAPDFVGSFRPTFFEKVFGIGDVPPLLIEVQEDQLLLRGVIDRVDTSPEGVRIIDYKTAGKSHYGMRDVLSGKKLQLPLYALAFRDAIGRREPVDGFYWHVRAAERSGFRMAGVKGGPRAAMEAATEHAFEAVRGIRAGAFAPHPPEEGCPSWCPAATFCWHYR